MTNLIKWLEKNNIKYFANSTKTEITIHEYPSHYAIFRKSSQGRYVGGIYSKKYSILSAKIGTRKQATVKEILEKYFL